jgi:hypothetical protein
MQWLLKTQMDSKYGLKVCDGGTLIQILCFWTLFIVLFYLKHRPVFIIKHNVLVTGFCLRLQVKPSQLDPELVPISGDPESSLQNVAFLNKNRTMDNVQKHNICIKQTG